MIVIVKEILKNNGFESKVEIDQRLPNDESKRGKLQNQDDLTFLKQLASENGLYFFFTYDNTGKELAHFHKLPLDEKPMITLVINHNDPAKNNIDELSINWDADVPTKVVGQHLDTKTKKENRCCCRQSAANKARRHVVATNNKRLPTGG